MSEETIQAQEKEHTCKCKLGAVLVIASFLLSLASLGLSTYTYLNGHIGAEKKVVISTQYDKGKSFEKAQETKKPMIVFFYTDWCGFCQKFAPTFDKVSKDKEIKKNFAIAYVNCEDSKNSQLMSKYGIQAFPTVYVVNGDKNTQLENNTFFNDDSVEVIKKNALEAIK